MQRLGQRVLRDTACSTVPLCRRQAGPASAAWRPRFWRLALFLLAWSPRCCGVGVDVGAVKSLHESLKVNIDYTEYARQAKKVRFVSNVTSHGNVYELAPEGEDRCNSKFEALGTREECQLIRMSFCDAERDISVVKNNAAPAGCVVKPGVGGKACSVFFNTAKQGRFRKGVWKICKKITETPQPEAEASPAVEVSPIATHIRRYFWLFVLLVAASIIVPVVHWVCASSPHSVGSPKRSPRKDNIPNIPSGNLTSSGSSSNAELPKPAFASIPPATASLPRLQLGPRSSTDQAPPAIATIPRLQLGPRSSTDQAFSHPRVPPLRGQLGPDSGRPPRQGPGGGAMPPPPPWPCEAQPRAAQRSSSARSSSTAATGFTPRANAAASSSGALVQPPRPKPFTPRGDAAAARRDDSASRSAAASTAPFPPRPDGFATRGGPPSPAIFTAKSPRSDVPTARSEVPAVLCGPPDADKATRGGPPSPAIFTAKSPRSDVPTARSEVPAVLCGTPDADKAQFFSLEADDHLEYVETWGSAAPTPRIDDPRQMLSARSGPPSTATRESSVTSHAGTSQANTRARPGAPHYSLSPPISAVDGESSVPSSDSEYDDVEETEAPSSSS